MQYDLVGYLLNLLEPEEERAVERYLEKSPEARRQLVSLRKALNPLEHDAEGPKPPPGLVVNTLKGVAAYRCQKSPATLPLPPSRPVSKSRWRRADVLIAASVALVVLLAMPPALLYLRHRQEVVACAANMSRLHQSLMLYAGDHKGELPAPDEQGPLAAAGAYGVKLRDAGYWSDAVQVNCPGKLKGATPYALPSTAELKRQFEANPQEYRRVLMQLGGCYGYHLGYVDANGKLRPLRSDSGNELPVMADCPPREEENACIYTSNSLNHNGFGQNVLYLGGNVRFEKRRVINGDDIFLNADNVRAAGRHLRDIVIAPGESRPLPEVE